MAKIITDKKPFITERSERIVVTDEVMLHADMPLRDVVEPQARKARVPEGLTPIQMGGRLDTQEFLFHWWEIVL